MYLFLNLLDPVRPKTLLKIRTSTIVLLELIFSLFPTEVSVQHKSVTTITTT